MPIPTSISDLSTTAASNSPQGSESPTEGDNYIRALSAIIAQETALTTKAAQLADTASASNGPNLVGANLQLAYADDTVGGVLRQFNPIRKYGDLNNDGVSDDSATFIAAVASGDRFIDARGLNCRISTPIALADNTVFLLDGTTFRITGTTAKVFTASAVDGWALVGPFSIIGDLTVDPGTSVSATGVEITDCANWRIDQPSCENIQGYGIRMLPGSSTRARGEGGQVVAPRFKSCVWGWFDEEGTGAEYVTVLGIHATNCAQAGITTSAGNVQFIGGQSVDNVRDGVRLRRGVGSNNAHGSFVCVQINHNDQYNLHAQSISNGETFIGCHFYNNGAGSAPIYLESCSGIHIRDGIIDSPVYVDTGPYSGLNVIAGNFLPGSQFSKNTNTPGALSLLYCTDNMTTAGPSSLNDPAFLSILATRTTSTQSLTAGSPVVAIFNTENNDNRAVYDATTGVYTVPASLASVAHRATVSVTVTAASGLTSVGYVEFRVNASVVGFAPLVAVSGTIAIATGSFAFVPASGNAVDVRVFVNAGATTPVLATTTSRLQIEAG
jgi:hypothetical protein